jgi:hypothetical protein
MNSSHPASLSKVQYGIILVCIVLLGSSLISIWIGSLAHGARYFTGKIGDLVPSSADLSEWTVAELPIAETPEMQRAVAELLNFEQGIHREYKRAGLRVSIYLAYWSPGRMSQRSVGGHTPDVCWVAAGWSNRRPGAQTIQYDLPGRGQVALQGRQFKSEAVIEHVVFGHFVRGRTVSYGNGDGDGPPWYSFVTDLLSEGFSQREEQFFIRISSNRPVAEILASEPARESLARLGYVLARSRVDPVK